MARNMYTIHSVTLVLAQVLQVKNLEREGKKHQHMHKNTF